MTDTHPAGPDEQPLAGAGAVLLDVDDTLIDTRAAMSAAGGVAARAAWPDLDDDTASAFGVRYHADPGGFFPRYTTGELTFEQMRDARLRETAGHHELAWADGEQGSYAAFEAAWPDAFRSSVALFDDVLPFLESCRSAGLLVGALTNSSQTFTELKLEAVGLADAFTAVATTDTLGFGKPDPRAFHRACELLGADPATTVYIGDDLEVDARAATAAGLHGIWLDRRGEGADERGMARPGLDVDRIFSLAQLGVARS